MVVCREKKLAAKAQGRRHASSDDEESEADAGSQEGEAGDQDPFFQREDNPFDDPFFKVNSQSCCAMLLTTAADGIAGE